MGRGRGWQMSWGRGLELALPHTMGRGQHGREGTGSAWGRGLELAPPTWRGLAAVAGAWPTPALPHGRAVVSARRRPSRGGAKRPAPRPSAHSAPSRSPSAAEEKSTGSILDDIGSMFDDLADQLDAMLE